MHINLPRAIADKYLSGIFIFSLVVLIVGFSVVYAEYADRAASIIIHWDVFRGVDALGTVSDLYEILAIALTALSVNLFLAIAVFDRERFLSYVLASAGFAFSVPVFAAILAIIKIN
ncbi:MAG: hypothetical protein HZA37_02395 [Parcubacteria group bacterium]|nr:hypothetical protein [Parcubacteria group bacterium]